MGSRNQGRGSSGTPWATVESKKERLSVRRYVSVESIPDISRIFRIVDQSREIRERGMLYDPRYARMTLISTEELPLGKKYRTADIVARVPSCSRRRNVILGGFDIFQIGKDKPKLGIEVTTTKAAKELSDLTDAFEEKELKLRGDIAVGPRQLHISVAEIDRDTKDYFTRDKLNELNEMVGATVHDAGVFAGSVLLNAVSLPAN